MAKGGNTRLQKRREEKSKRWKGGEQRNDFYRVCFIARRRWKTIWVRLRRLIEAEPQKTFYGCPRKIAD